jgi:hypothetical protein
MKKILFILVVVIGFSSCKNGLEVPACNGCLTFYFENPQPVKDSELDHFPSKFRGLYMDKDSLFVRIEEDRILTESFYKFKIHKSDIDSLKGKFNVINNQLVDKQTREKMDMRPVGDSLELTNKSIDTIFRFSYNQKAKRINGDLVLSTRDSIFWNVEFLSVENNTIKFRNLYYPEDLKRLDSLTNSKSKIIDSVSYLVKPTRSEFKKILKLRNLGYDNQYKKI